MREVKNFSHFFYKNSDKIYGNYLQRIAPLWYTTCVAKKSHIWLSLQVPNLTVSRGCKAGSIWKKKTNFMEEKT